MLTKQDLCNEEYSELLEWIGASELNTYQIEDLLGIVGRLTQRQYCGKTDCDNDNDNDNELYNYSPVKLILTEILASGMQMLDENRNVKRFMYDYMENVVHFKEEVQKITKLNQESLTLVKNDINQVRSRFTRLETICSLLADGAVCTLPLPLFIPDDVPETLITPTPGITIKPIPSVSKRPFEINVTTPSATKSTAIPKTYFVATKSTPLAIKSNTGATKLTPVATKSIPVAQKLTQIKTTPSVSNVGGEKVMNDRLRDLQNQTLNATGLSIPKHIVISYKAGVTKPMGKNMTIKTVPIQKLTKILPTPAQRDMLKVKPISSLIGTPTEAPTFNKTAKVVLKRFNETEMMQKTIGETDSPAKRTRLMQNDVIELDDDEPVVTAVVERSRPIAKSSVMQIKPQNVQYKARSRSPTCLEALVSIAKANGYNSPLLNDSRKTSLSYKAMHTGIFPIRTIKALQMYENFCMESSHQSAAIHYLISLRPSSKVWNEILYTNAIRNTFGDNALASFKHTHYKISKIILSQWAPHSMEKFSRLFYKEIDDACKRLKTLMIDPLSN